MRVSRISTVVFGLAATAAAVNPPGTIIGLYNWRAILLTSALLVPVYVTLYWRDTAGKAVLLSIVLGALFGPGWEVLDAPMGVPATFMGVGMAVLGLVVGHFVWRTGEETPTGAAATDD
jgi:sodium/proline symporter